MAKNKEPKIMIFDIEIVPDLTKCLRKWVRLYDRAAMSANFSTICTIGYKIHGSKKKAKTINIWDFEGWKENIYDDSDLLAYFQEEMEREEVDILVSHFGDRFDKPHLETRFLVNGLPNMTYIRNIDTWKIAKQKLKLSHRTLNDLATLLGCDLKMDNGGWDIWESIVAHTVFEKEHRRKGLMPLKKACQIMDKYCAQDVETLDQVFGKLKHLTNLLPNHNNYLVKGAPKVCPSCGGKHFHKNGFHRTPVSSFQRYRCASCGVAFRTTKADTNPRVI